MKLFSRLSKEGPAANDRRKDFAERLRRQREIDEEWRKRLRFLRERPGLLFI